jgi:hypothetical protein
MGMSLLALAAGNSFLFLYVGSAYFGYYPIAMEICGLLLCLYFTQKQRQQLS